MLCGCAWKHLRLSRNTFFFVAYTEIFLEVIHDSSTATYPQLQGKQNNPFSNGWRPSYHTPLLKLQGLSLKNRTKWQYLSLLLYQPSPAAFLLTDFFSYPPRDITLVTHHSPYILGHQKKALQNATHSFTRKVLLFSFVLCRSPTDHLPHFHQIKARDFQSSTSLTAFWEALKIIFLVESYAEILYGSLLAWFFKAHVICNATLEPKLALERLL